MTKHGLIRKVGKKQWSVCWLDTPCGGQVRFLESRDEVQKQLDKLKAIYATDKYAIVDYHNCAE